MADNSSMNSLNFVSAVLIQLGKSPLHLKNEHERLNSPHL